MGIPRACAHRLSVASPGTSRWLLVPAACLRRVDGGVGISRHRGAARPRRSGSGMPRCRRRLVEYRQQEGISESKLITSLSETPTIVALTALAAAVFRWKFGRWRESLVVIYAVVGETSHLHGDDASHRPPAAERAATRCGAADLVVPLGPHRCRRVLLRSIAAIIIWHTRHRWIKVVAVVVCAAVPLTDRRQPRVSRHALPDRRARRRRCSARSG